MESRHKLLLAIDGAVNLLLGALLLLFPAGLLELVGAPPTSTQFYPSILGAVIFGIGVALFLELFGATKNVPGLGVGGAIAINLCGGGALLIWLLVHSFDIPLRGHIILWSIAVLVLGIGIAEIATNAYRYDRPGS